MDPAQPQDKLLEKLRRIRALLLIGDISTTQEDIPVWSMERIRQICSGAETGNTGESKKTKKTEKTGETEKTEDMCWLQSDRKEDDEAYLIFTSGTTGTDKCVVRTQRNTAAVLKEICSAFAYGREQLLILPAYHLYAIEKVITPVLAMGLP
jgi:long-subunit acyl-CoA synthetase (AMP-forming)